MMVGVREGKTTEEVKVVVGDRAEEECSAMDAEGDDGGGVGLENGGDDDGGRVILRR